MSHLSMQAAYSRAELLCQDLHPLHLPLVFTSTIADVLHEEDKACCMQGLYDWMGVVHLEDAFFAGAVVNALWKKPYTELLDLPQSKERLASLFRRYGEHDLVFRISLKSRPPRPGMSYMDFLKHTGWVGPLTMDRLGIQNSPPRNVQIPVVVGWGHNQ